jgi:cytochrome c-type biogenesis protein CcmE
VTPAELVAKGADIHDAPVRLGGQVKAGSVQWNADALDLRFELTDGTADVFVHSKGAPPQMFRDGMGVVVEGRLTRDGVFQSTNLMVMHSNEYRAPDSGEKPQDRYHQLERRATILP